MPERKARWPRLGAPWALLALACVPLAGAWDDYYPRAAGESRRPGPAPAETLDSDTGPVRSGAAAPAPDFPSEGKVPDVPRLLFRADLEVAVAQAGPSDGRSGAVLHRLDTDSGTIWSAIAPDRAGADGVRILRVLPGGKVRADTLPISRIRAIHAPRAAGKDTYHLAGLTLGVLIPVYFGVNSFPYPLAPILGSDLAGWTSLPAWPEYAPAEFLDHPRRWTATFGTTQGVTLRTVLNGADLRNEPVWTAHLQADAGRRHSPITYGLGIRVLPVRSPLAREAVHDSSWERDAYRERDSVYAAHPWGAALEASVALVWAESPAYTLRTRAGAYFSFASYAEERLQPANRAPELGPLFGMELDWRPVPHWALRLEGKLLTPAREPYDLSLVPALGAGFAYRLDERPAPARAPGTTAALTLLFAGKRLVPGLEMEQDLDRWQSTGLAAAFSRERRTGGYYYSETSHYETSSRADYGFLSFTYGIHTERDRPVHAGLRLSAGVGTRRERILTSTTFQPFDRPPETRITENREASYGFAFGISPEIGARIGMGFGALARILLINPDPVGERPGLPFSLGLTYALPPRGVGR